MYRILPNMRRDMADARIRSLGTDETGRRSRRPL